MYGVIVNLARFHPFPGGHNLKVVYLDENLFGYYEIQRSRSRYLASDSVL